MRAWHVPALRRKATVTADRALLKGLPKVRTDMTWVPWTHRRLSRASGYGAGITSPGWYGHLFSAPDRPVERWLTKVAGLLREEDRIVSSAHVIEAVRLAGTLAALRGRPLPGLSETTDAVRAVMCDGSDVPLALVRDRLIVGDVLGEVPQDAPAVPLQRDLARLQRRLRLKPEALERELELDLRKDTDAGRSRLLHRLRLLGIGWGEPAASRGSTGTFRETWRLRWEPELSVRVAEAGIWGTTVRGAATAKAEADAVAAQHLAEVTALAERCLLAGLPDALPTVMRVLADRAALDTDVGHLAQALPALVRSLRYGDVRGTDTGALAEVAAGLAERVFVGLPPACAALDAEAAEQMRRHVDAVHGAVGLLGDDPAPGHADLRARWRSVLRVLSGRDTVPGVIRGRAVRLLLDDGELTPEETARQMGLTLSRARRRRTPPRGSRGSSAAAPGAGCCSSTTSGSSDWSTPGSPGCRPRRSRTCCRCCGGRSRRTSRGCAAAWASWSGAGPRGPTARRPPAGAYPASRPASTPGGRTPWCGGAAAAGPGRTRRPYEGRQRRYGGRQRPYGGRHRPYGGRQRCAQDAAADDLVGVEA